MAVTGCDVVLEVLRSEGVRHVFGNPGTTELPLLDALAGVDDVRYVLALQEATAVAMADGYAQVTGRPAFLNLHALGGLGNALGNLTNAQAARTPLVVTAGQQDQRHLVADPLLAGDLAGLAAPAAKWAREVRGVGELGTVLRRAFTDAASPPTGPVFVSLPVDVLSGDSSEPLAALVPPRTRVERGAVAGALDELATLLATAPVGELAIVAGDEVAAAGAVGPLVALAESLGARVLGATLHARTVFPTAHPLWAGALGLGPAEVHRQLDGLQRLFVIGSRVFMAYNYRPGGLLPAGLELLHLSPDPGDLGRTWPARLAVAGDVRATLEALVPLVADRADPSAAWQALEVARARRPERDARADAAAVARYGDAPMAPRAAVHALLRALPPEPVVVDEAMTSDVYLREYHRVTQPGRYFFCRGGGLGWGMPAAAGVSLGLGREPVACLVGDGSALYSPQALWTAARERLPVLFAVLDNRQYLMLKENLARERGTPPERFVGMDLDEPALDFLALARSMGVASARVERAGEVGDAVRAALAAGGPFLLHLPVSTGDAG